MEDRRARPRQRVFKAGTIELDGSGVDCTIRNVSATGAALVASPIGILHEITLNVVNRQRTSKLPYRLAQGEEDLRGLRRLEVAANLARRLYLSD
jgi:hypothetical protein